MPGMPGKRVRCLPRYLPRIRPASRRARARPGVGQAACSPSRPFSPSRPATSLSESPQLIGQAMFAVVQAASGLRLSQAIVAGIVERDDGGAGCVLGVVPFPEPVDDPEPRADGGVFRERDAVGLEAGGDVQCGRPRTGPRTIGAHHLDPLSESSPAGWFDVSRIVTLCSSCHGQADATAPGTSRRSSPNRPRPRSSHESEQQTPGQSVFSRGNGRHPRC
jgi:hypothetical protein